MGSFYRSARTHVRFKNGDTPHINSFELGQHGRYRTNVWEYRGVNTLKRPTQRACFASNGQACRNGRRCDERCFAPRRHRARPLRRFGLDLIAAHKTGRRARLCELDPIYCDRMLRRWEIFARTTLSMLRVDWRSGRRAKIPRLEGAAPPMRSSMIRRTVARRPKRDPEVASGIATSRATGRGKVWAASVSCGTLTPSLVLRGVTGNGEGS